MNNCIVFIIIVPVLIYYYPSTNELHRVTRKVQLRGIGIRHNGGGLVSLAIYRFGYKITKKGNSPARKPMHAFGPPTKCVR